MLPMTEISCREGLFLVTAFALLFVGALDGRGMSHMVTEPISISQCGQRVSCFSVSRIVRGRCGRIASSLDG